MNHFFSFGFGYTSKYLIEELSKYSNWKFTATSRTSFINDKVNCVLFDQLINIPKDITHILISIPPDIKGDLVINKFASLITKLPNLKWVGYLSSTSVYGDTKGAWVNEDSRINPNNRLAANRVLAEREWQNLYKEFNIPLNIFRISGIYGPLRNPICKIQAGKDYIIYKENQVFSRIHIYDITQTLIISIRDSLNGDVYNLADDYPCSTLEIFEYCSKLLNLPNLKIKNYNDENLNEMEKIFYGECRRVSNSKIKTSLNMKLKYSTYKEGMLSLF